MIEKYEFMRIVCRYSKTKKEAKETIMSSFRIKDLPESQWKSENEREINRFIKREWSSSKKINKYSPRNRTIKELVVLVNLIYREKGVVFEKVFVPIKKKIEGNKLPRELYDLIITDSTKEKEKLRGGYVELNSVSMDGLVMYCTEKNYTFMIHDIDCSRNFVFS